MAEKKTTTKTTAERAKEVGAKVPTDHKLPAEAPLEDLPGADLLVPPGKLFHGTLARFLGASIPLIGELEGLDTEEGEDGEATYADMGRLLMVAGPLLELMRDYAAKDPKAFELWASGDNLEDSINLAVKYVSAAGESVA